MCNSEMLAFHGPSSRRVSLNAAIGCCHMQKSYKESSQCAKPGPQPRQAKGSSGAIQNTLSLQQLTKWVFSSHSLHSSVPATFFPSVPQLHLSKGDYVLSMTMHRPESSLDCWGPLKDSQQSYAFSLELAASSPNAIPSFLLGSGSKDHCLQEALPNLPPHSSRSNHLYYSLTF